MRSEECIELEEKYGAHNYHPIPVVLAKGSGVLVWDPEGNQYYDFLSAYSAFFGYDMVLPMNTGAEGVETALKLARKWGYLKKKIPQDEAIIISCANNFHGRTIAIISMSTDNQCRKDFGPFLNNVGSQCPISKRILNYNSIKDLEAALEAHGQKIAGFLVEPIQGEAGIYVPDDGYLSKCYELCKKHNVLFIVDEIQTGLARTGKMLAVDHENVKPDILILGKALSGGMYPVSAVLSSKEIMLCIQPGEHGSTYGGNPLGCSLAMEALQILKDENLCQRAEILGNKLRKALSDLKHPLITTVRGKGLLNAIVIDDKKYPKKTAWNLCLIMKKRGLLAKPTHENIIRLAPPLVITDQQMDACIEIITGSLNEIMTQ